MTINSNRVVNFNGEINKLCINSKGNVNTAGNVNCLEIGTKANVLVSGNSEQLLVNTSLNVFVCGNQKKCDLFSERGNIKINGNCDEAKFKAPVGRISFCGVFNDITCMYKHNIPRIITAPFSCHITEYKDESSGLFVTELTEEEYIPYGPTALLDAIGHTTDLLASHFEKEEGNKAIFYITTDGMENSSEDYSYSLIKKMIKWHENKNGWEYNFIAANIDELAVGSELGISKKRTSSFEATSEGCNKMMKKMSASVCESVKNIKKAIK